MYDYIAGERVHTERAGGGVHSTKSVVESYLTIVSILQVGVPMRSVQVEGMYSNTGRAQAAEGSLMWDADGDKNMKLGLKGQLDKRGKTKKVQLGLDLPFVDKVRAEWISKPQHNTTRHSANLFVLMCLLGIFLHLRCENKLGVSGHERVCGGDHQGDHQGDHEGL